MMRPFSLRVLRVFGMGVALGCGPIHAAGAETPAAPPEISLSLRGVSGATVEAGEPLRIAVRVDPPAEGPPRIVLAPARGSWINATTVEILSADGVRVVAGGKPAVVAADASVVLEQEQAAHGLWWFDSETMARLAPGEYSVRARLAIRDGTGWKGESVSEPAPLTVVAASSDPQRVSQRVLARAHAAVLQDAPAKAAEILDEVLKQDPDNIPLLEMRAALCLSGGDPASAYVCINRARTLAARQGGEPSVQLHEFASRIEVALAGNAAAAAPEAWSSAPLIVFSALRPPAAETATRADATPAMRSDPNIAAPLSSSSAQRPILSLTSTPSLAPRAATEVSSVVPAANSGPGVVVPAAELSDPKIIADPHGQWASSATAGSQYGKTQYSAAQATGAPNISVAGNSPDAWCPAVRDKGTDWLELTFAKPMRATEVRVRQNDASGAIVKIEAFEANGTPHVWWEGVDPSQKPGVREIVWFAVRVPKTEYAVVRVKLTLNLASGPGYKEIDAVQLVAAP